MKKLGERERKKGSVRKLRKKSFLAIRSAGT